MKEEILKEVVDMAVEEEEAEAQKGKGKGNFQRGTKVKNSQYCNIYGRSSHVGKDCW